MYWNSLYVKKVAILNTRHNSNQEKTTRLVNRSSTVFVLPIKVKKNVSQIKLTKEVTSEKSFSCKNIQKIL